MTAILWILVVGLSLIVWMLSDALRDAEETITALATKGDPRGSDVRPFMRIAK